MIAPGRSRRFGVARWSALGVGAVAIALVAVLATRQPASQQLAQSPLLGKVAPSLAGRTLTGSAANLSSYRGRFVLVNFFASWCSVCQAEDPQLERFRFTRPAGRAPAVLGVLYGDSVADGINFQRSEGATWPAVVDPGGTIASNWGVGSLPRSYLVAPDGRVVDCILGGITAAQLDALVTHAAHRPSQ